MNTPRSVDPRLLAVLLAPAVALTFGGRASGESAPVVLSTEPDGPASAIELRLPHDATGTTIPVYLRNVTAEPIPVLRIYTTPTRDDGGLAHEAAVTVTFPSPEDEDAPALGPNAEVAGELSIEGLNESGVFTASVVAEIADDQIQLALVTIEKETEILLGVRGAGDAGLEITSRTSHFLRAFDLVSRSNVDTTVEIRMGRVLGPDNQPTAAQLTVGCELPSGPLQLGPLADLQFELAIDTPLTGEYIGSIDLLYGDQRAEIPLKITRVRQAAPIETRGGYVSPAQIWFGGSAQVDVTVTETEGLPAAIRSPRLLDIYRNEDGQKIRASIKVGQVTLGRAGSAPEASPSISPAIEPVPSPGAPSPTGECPAGADDEHETDGDLILVPAGEGLSVTMTLEGLTEPGEYHGTARFDFPEGSPVDQDFTLVVKRTWFFAFLVIGAGVLAGELIRRLATKWIPVLRFRRDLSRLERHRRVLRRAPGRDASDNAMLVDLRHRIDDVEAMLGTDQWQAAADRIGALDAQLGNFTDWSLARKALAKIDKTPFDTRWAAVVAAFDARTLTDADKAALEDLRALRREAEAKVPRVSGAPRGQGGRNGGELWRFVGLAEGALRVGLIVIASLIGVLLLWAPDPTWGDVGDLLTAVLWGIGAYAATGTAFGGTDKLLETITGEPA